MSRSGRGAGAPLRRAAGAGVLGAAGWVGYSSFFIPHALNLPPAVGGERRETERRAGRLSYYVAGDGAPLLLIHSINAAGSAYEVGPVFERLKADRRVYAVDLPGFGFSDRSGRAYSPRLYTDAVHDLLDVIADEAGDQPLDALALSLSSEFLARAALERPERFRSLALVTPTGFERGADRRRGPPGSTREVAGLYGLFTFPVWSQAFYDLLVSRPSIRFFLKKTFGSDQYDRGLAEYDYLTAHQPGAKNAPFAFVSGRLFSNDIRTVYEGLNLPIWVPHATRGDFQDFTDADWARQRPNWSFEAWKTGALPHFEQPEAFCLAYQRFLRGTDDGEAEAQPS